MDNGTSQNDSDAVIVLSTAPDEATAQDLASLMLNMKLAACVSLLPNTTSLYHWQGKIEHEYEVQMLFKTNRQQVAVLLSTLKQHHPYEVPELLVLPVNGDKDYISWLNASLS